MISSEVFLLRSTIGGIKRFHAVAKIACIMKWSSIHHNDGLRLQVFWQGPWEVCSMFSGHTLFDSSGMIVEIEYPWGQKWEMQPADFGADMNPRVIKYFADSFWTYQFKPLYLFEIQNLSHCWNFSWQSFNKYSGLMATISHQFLCFFSLWDYSYCIFQCSWIGTQ